MADVRNSVSRSTDDNGDKATTTRRRVLTVGAGALAGLAGLGASGSTETKAQTFPDEGDEDSEVRVVDKTTNDPRESTWDEWPGFAPDWYKAEKRAERRKNHGQQ